MTLSPVASLFMKALRVLPLAFVTVLGCDGKANPTPPAGDVDMAIAAADAAMNACAAAGPIEVSFDTDDAVRLVADLYTTGKTGGPSVVLLHMIPPANDRSNYPRTFIDALVAKGLSVLNVDRRGAGSSGGVAGDAYLGPKGKLDAKAAQAFLLHHPCAPDPGRIAFVGASNGTTTALDFTVLSVDDTSVKKPAALVFLTGGTYTENNTTIATHQVVLDPLPILFVFSTAERAWSAGLQGRAPATWRFKEYNPGDHGTRMFQAQPGAVDEIASFLVDALR